MEKNNKSAEKYELQIKTENLNLPAEIINYDAKDIEDYFEFIFNLLKSTNFSYIKFGIYLIRKQLTLENNPPISKLCDRGLVHQLLSNLEVRITDEQIVYEILWCFINITSSMEDLNTLNFLVTPYAINLFDKIITNNKNLEILNHLIWLLSHLVSESIDVRDIFFSSVLYRKILNSLPEQILNKELMKNYCWFFANLSKGKPAPSLLQRFEISRNLCLLVQTPDLIAVNFCLFGLYNLIDVKESQTIIHLIIETGAGLHIVKNIGYNPSLTGIIIKIIGNILTGESQDVKEMLNYGVLDLLENLYKSNHNTLIEKEILWAISNITAGSQSDINFFMQSNLMKILFEKTKTITNINLMLELVWIFSNAISGGGIEIACDLIKFGILEIYLHIIDNFESEIIQLVALEGLRSLFHYGEAIKALTEKNQIVESFCKIGGINCLEKLSNSNRHEICMKVEQLIKEFFILD